MTALFIIKFGSEASDWIKTVGGVAFGNLEPHMVLYSTLNKNFKVPYKF